MRLPLPQFATKERHPDRIAEVIETATSEFLAQCLEPEDLSFPAMPPFGSWVKAQDEESKNQIYGVVYYATTSPIDSVHYLVLEGIVGAVVGLWLFDIIALAGSLAFRRTAMGAGDSKLAALMGAWLGWKYLLIAGFIACLAGAFAGGGAIAIGLLDRRQPVPFGPFLALGTAITALWGEPILSTYLQLFFPNFSF